MTQTVPHAVLDILCPMHMILDGNGRITHAGPTVRKLSANGPVEGRAFLEMFSVNRPRAITKYADLRKTRGNRLYLETRASPFTSLKGAIIALEDGSGGTIVNLSFGISIIDGVREYGLTNADFAPTDMAIEMLYLFEAKSAVFDAWSQMHTRLEGAKIAAEEQAFTDTLTGLKNRRALDMVLQRLSAGSTPFAVMQIDLDFFKQVNDTLGHAAGDHVLQTVARVIVEETRSTDIVARVGGDEFTVVLPDVRSDKILQRVGRRIIRRLEVPIPFQGDRCEISASIGTAFIKEGYTPSLEELLSDADVALYASKKAGRARQTFYRPELREAANAGLPLVGRTERRTN